MARTRKSSPNHRKPLSVSARAAQKVWKRAPDHYARHPHLKQPGDRVGAMRIPSGSPGRGGVRLSRSFHPTQHRFNPAEETLYDSDSSDNSIKGDNGSEEEAFFHWEEEDTLLSELLGADPDNSKTHELEDLVHSLQPAFDEYGLSMKKEIADKLVPAVNRVKTLYQTVETDIDKTYGMGIIVFNDACKELEALSIRDKDDLNQAWTQYERRIEDLFEQLKHAYATREQLWIEFEQALKETGEKTLEVLRDAPARVERAIAKLEKQARNLEKEDSSTASNMEKKIKGLLNKAL